MNSMDRFLFGVIPFATGVVAILFHRQLAALQVRSQNQTWGFRMGPRSEAASRFACVVVGIAFLVYGMIGLAGLFPVRH